MSLFWLIFMFVGLNALLDTIITLNGDDWMVTNGSMTPIPAVIPGEIYQPLLDAGMISKPYYDMNPMNLRWIPQTNWNYTKIFNINEDSKFIDNNDVIQLICAGIDTKANVYINGKLIFYNDNMFHKSIINVKDYLMYGNNTILVELYNKVDWANEVNNSCSNDVDGQCPGCADQEYGFTCVNYIRTEPASFGWDWVCHYL